MGVSKSGRVGDLKSVTFLVWSFTIFLSFSESHSEIRMSYSLHDRLSSTLTLEDEVNLSRFNASNPLPVIPDPPSVETISVDAVVLKWLNTLPNDGQLRVLMLNSYNFNVGMTLADIPEVANSKGSLGAVQRWLDGWRASFTNIRNYLVDTAKIVYSYDKKGNLICTSGGYCQNVKDLGWVVRANALALELKNEIINPKSGREDATKWFTEQKSLHVKSSSSQELIQWFEKVRLDAMSQLAKYQMKEPNKDNLYYVEYKETLLKLASDAAPEIQEEIERQARIEWWKQFFSDHKWWIVGGVVGVVTIYAIWKIM